MSDANEKNHSHDTIVIIIIMKHISSYKISLSHFIILNEMFRVYFVTFFIQQYIMNREINHFILMVKVEKNIHTSYSKQKKILLFNGSMVTGNFIENYFRMPHTLSNYKYIEFHSYDCLLTKGEREKNKKNNNIVVSYRINNMVVCMCLG